MLLFLFLTCVPAHGCHRLDGSPRAEGSPGKRPGPRCPAGFPGQRTVGPAGGPALRAERSAFFPALNAPLSRRLISISLTDEWSRLMAAGGEGPFPPGAPAWRLCCPQSAPPAPTRLPAACGLPAEEEGRALPGASGRGLPSPAGGGGPGPRVLVSSCPRHRIPRDPRQVQHPQEHPCPPKLGLSRGPQAPPLPPSQGCAKGDAGDKSAP